jgi:hypothetical protein
MKKKIAYFNRFEISLSEECVRDCSSSGPVDDAVEYWARKTSLNMSDEDLKAELKEYGAWEDEELNDRETNERRIVWIAACNIKEEEK